MISSWQWIAFVLWQAPSAGRTPNLALGTMYLPKDRYLPAFSIPMFVHYFVWQFLLIIFRRWHPRTLQLDRHSSAGRQHYRKPAPHAVAYRIVMQFHFTLMFWACQRSTPIRKTSMGLGLWNRISITRFTDSYFDHLAIEAGMIRSSVLCTTNGRIHGM